MRLSNAERTIMASAIKASTSDTEDPVSDDAQARDELAPLLDPKYLRTKKIYHDGLDPRFDRKATPQDLWGAAPEDKLSLRLWRARIRVDRDEAEFQEQIAALRAEKKRKSDQAREAVAKAEQRLRARFRSETDKRLRTIVNLCDHPDAVAILDRTILALQETKTQCSTTRKDLT